MEMPNTKPAAITNKILEEKFELAKRTVSQIILLPRCIKFKLMNLIQ